MKKLALFVLLTAAAGMLFAQNNPSTVTVTGTLGLSGGDIVLKNETATYVTRLNRFVGFIDGLKDGAQVTIEGYVENLQTEKFLHPVTLTLNGKVYEVGRTMTAQWRGGRMGPPMGPPPGGGRRGWCW